MDNSNDFGHSWAIDDRDCEPPVDPEPCLEGSQRYRQAADLCYLLIDETGELQIHMAYQTLWIEFLEESGFSINLQAVFRTSISLMGPSDFSSIVGPFAPCHDYVDPGPYHEACVYDLCETLPDDDLLCDSAESYAAACRSAGRALVDWKREAEMCRK